MKQKKLTKTDKGNYLNSNIDEENIVIEEKKKEKLFNNRIGSIQHEEEKLNSNSQNSSPKINEKTPEKLT